MLRFSIKKAAPLAAALVLAAALMAGASGLFGDGAAPAGPAAAVDAGPQLPPASGAGAERPAATRPGPAAPTAGDTTAPGSSSGPASGRVPEPTARRPLTRAELAEMLAEAFALPAADDVGFSDIQVHPSRRAVAAVVAAGVMDGWFDGTFRPDQPVSRADLTVAAVRALGLEETAAVHPPAEPVFRDVPPDHRAFAAVGMAHRLGLLPFHTGSFFAPDEAVEPAEARHMIRAAAALERLEGPVAFVHAAARTVGVQEDARRSVSFTAGDETLIVRNGAAATLDALRPGDQVRVLADTGGRLLVAAAAGADSPGSAVINEATKVLRELATPEQLAAIIARDWERAGAELRVSLYNQLLETGVSAEEAAALLEQDWASVEEHAKRRLTELVSQRADVDAELVRAVLDQDWDAAVSHIEVEVLEYALNALMAPAQ